MSVRNDGEKGWLVDIRPQGRAGKRVRKHFQTKSEALKFERWIITVRNNKDWQDKPIDKRPLKDLIELWWTLKGQSLRSGEDMYKRLLNLDKRMHHPNADKITNQSFSDYRAFRLTQGRSPTTINLEQDYLSAMFSCLIETGQFAGINPLAAMKQISLIRTEMGFLHMEEISLLLSKLKGDDLLVVKLCLSTGARWSEASSMTSNHVIQNRVTFTKTKNGKNRTVPISPLFSCEITAQGGRQLFPDVNYKRVRETIKELFPHLPPGQATHVLRHTFASHFMMNGGNILALQKILGHSRIEQTMVYAHFAPDYLNDAVKFNPLEQLK